MAETWKTLARLIEQASKGRPGVLTDASGEKKVWWPKDRLGQVIEMPDEGMGLYTVSEAEVLLVQGYAASATLSRVEGGLFERAWFHAKEQLVGQAQSSDLLDARIESAAQALRHYMTGKKSADKSAKSG